jgi:hypothetical protein
MVTANEVYKEQGFWLLLDKFQAAEGTKEPKKLRLFTL